MSLPESQSIQDKVMFMEDGLIYRFRFGNPAQTSIVAITFLLMFYFSMVGGALASNHYTTKQLDALAARVGKTFWLSSKAAQMPHFLSSPAATAPGFKPAEDDSFVITGLTGRSNIPYYEVKFESGKVGYIPPETFHEALNLTILTADPRADEKERAEKDASEEKDRVEWIKSQPWSPAVKEAAIRKQPPPGLRTGEVKRVLGSPMRVTKLRTPSKVSEEHWFYKDGSVLIFHNGLLTRIDNIEKK